MTADGEETRSRLLREARDLCVEEGFGGFSLREAARRAGVSAAAVYRHYDSKEALVGAVCAAGLQIFYGYLVRSLSERSPRARLKGCSMQYLRFGLEQPQDYRMLFMGVVEPPKPNPAPKARASKAGSHDPTFQFLVDRVRECMAAGVIRQSDADEMATVIWAHVHGMVSLWLVGQLQRLGSDADFTRFYEGATEGLIVGLAS